MLRENRGSYYRGTARITLPLIARELNKNELTIPADQVTAHPMIGVRAAIKNRPADIKLGPQIAELDHKADSGSVVLEYERAVAQRFIDSLVLLERSSGNLGFFRVASRFVSSGDKLKLVPRRTRSRRDDKGVAGARQRSLGRLLRSTSWLCKLRLEHKRTRLRPLIRVENERSG